MLTLVVVGVGAIAWGSGVLVWLVRLAVADRDKDPKDGIPQACLFTEFRTGPGYALKIDHEVPHED